MRYAVLIVGLLLCLSQTVRAQVSSTSARANNIQARYTYKTAVAQLEKAIGWRLE